MSLGNMDTEDALIRAVKFTPIIDNHAHPLVKASAIKKYPLLSITTEAHGDALNDTPYSLSHIRAVNRLSGLLQCDATWEAVEEAIRDQHQHKYTAWAKRCLSGIETVLVDDGLDDSSNVEPYTYFDWFTNTRAKRIVRIEQVATEIIEEACTVFSTPEGALGRVIDQFQNVINRYIAAPEVVGFKSVICYRTGLNIPRTMNVSAAVRVMNQIYQERRGPEGKSFTRLEHSGLNEYFVHRVAGLIRDSQEHRKKPIQFHTGLGDNDITLTKSSPAHLQEFIKEYPTVPIVLLHAGYPYTRETAYLATMYTNVYADIGEVFPCLNRDGQEQILRHMLELCPWNKILVSTDGHWFPEIFFLAAEQVREAVLNVLTDFVRRGDLTWEQAVTLVGDIFYNNSNKLYSLKLRPWAAGKLEAAWNGGSDRLTTSQHALSRFLAGGKEPRFLRVYWNDMTAMPRMRAIPMRRVKDLLRKREDISFGVTKAGLGLLQTDQLAPGVSATGEYRLYPDFGTLRLGPREGHITAMGDFKEKDGSPVQFCPRSLLKRTLERAFRQGLVFTLGFEIELVLVRRVETEIKYDTLNGDGHAWCIGRAMDHAAASVLEEAVLQLDEAGVYVETLHPESANGQYEVVLPKAPALEAVDTLLYARDIISNCATAKGLKMTLHPKPFAMECGTAAHMHLSISSTNGGNNARVYEPFYAGVLKHLNAIAAFTYSNIVSYDRVKDGCWAGGTWVAWGTQNREVPLRKIEGSHWEFKCMDGMANPYLAISAVLLAGSQGVAAEEKLIWGDCLRDPAALSDAERKTLNVTKKLPASIHEALDSLRDDDELIELLGAPLVRRYINVKTAETAMLEKMGDEERRRWVMERY